MKRYIEIDGLIYRPSGWTEQEHDDFMDEIIDVVEKWDGQAALGFRRRSEKELEDNFDKIPEKR